MPNTIKNVETILALDPGLRDLGFAVLGGTTLRAWGVLPLRLVARRKKLHQVEDSLGRLIRGHEPRALVWEHIPRRPLDTLAGLPALGRLLGRLAERFGLEFATYSARSVRSNVLGDGWAGKREVAERLAASFPELRVCLTQDRKWKEAYWQNMFDAVALALHHRSLNKPPSRSR